MVDSLYDGYLHAGVAQVRESMSIDDPNKRPLYHPYKDFTV